LNNILRNIIYLSRTTKSVLCNIELDELQLGLLRVLFKTSLLITYFAVYGYFFDDLLSLFLSLTLLILVGTGFYLTLFKYNKKQWDFLLFSFSIDPNQNNIQKDDQKNQRDI